MTKTKHEHFQKPYAPSEGTTIRDSDTRSLTGFIVSFSASESGEYWLLKEGKNFIGSDSSCDIVLKDMAVSKQHAIINIRENRNDKRLMIAITDQNSTNGVVVNDKDIEFTTHECKDRDKIKIGSYELVLFVVDKKAAGLEVNEKLKKSSEKPDYSRKSPYDEIIPHNNISSKIKRTKTE